MKLIIDNKPIKINNFVNYLVENYTENDKTNDFELIAEDKYDKRFIIEKESALKDKVLVMHNDGYEILGNKILEEYEQFKKAIENLIENKDFTSLYTPENFKKQFVHYHITIKDNKEERDFSFHFLNISKSD